MAPNIGRKIEDYASKHLRELKQQEAKTGKKFTKYDIAIFMIQKGQLNMTEFASWMNTREGFDAQTMSKQLELDLKLGNVWNYAGYSGGEESYLDSLVPFSEKSDMEKAKIMYSSNKGLKLAATKEERIKRDKEIKAEIKQQKVKQRILGPNNAAGNAASKALFKKHLNDVPGIENIPLFANRIKPEDVTKENLAKYFPESKYNIKMLNKIANLNSQTYIISPKNSKSPASIAITVFDDEQVNISKTIGFGLAEILSVNKYNRSYSKFDENNRLIIGHSSMYDENGNLEFYSKSWSDNNNKVQYVNYFYDKNKKIKKIVYSDKEPRYPEAEALQKDLHDIFYASGKDLPNLKKHFSKNLSNIIDKDNVFEMNGMFQNLTGKTLFDAIIGERRFSWEERSQYAVQIFETALKTASEQGVKTKDIVDKFNLELRNQGNSWSPANAKYLNTCFNQLLGRIRANYNPDNTTLVKPNGKVDKDFSQGATGDCWLLASIKAISMTSKGKDILDNSIKFEKDGTAVVTLKGVNKSYRVTPEELNRSTELAIGDADVRILEIAINKYFREQGGINNRPDIDGNNMQTAFYLLTGKGQKEKILIGQLENGLIDHIVNSNGYRKTYITDEQIDNFNKPNRAVCVATSGKADLTISGANFDEEEDITLYSDHAYVVSRSNGGHVYLINPWDTSKEIRVDRQTFTKFFDTITEIDL